MITLDRIIHSTGLNVAIVLEFFVPSMQHTNVRLVMQGKSLPTKFVIRLFNLKGL